MTETQITLVVFIKAKQQTKQLVKEQLVNLSEMTNKEPGNICYELSVANDDDSLFIIYENWKDQAALDYHMSQPYLKDFLGKEDQLEKPLSVTVCTAVK